MAKRVRLALSGVLGVALVMAGGAFATDKASSGKAEHEFIKDAASGGMMEVELGRLAATRAASPRVKEFGQRMVDDHGKANNELKQIAKQESVTLPETMTDQHREEVSRLSNLQGAEFDRAYMQAMLKDHQEDVEKFRQEASSGKDSSVRDFAKKTLPVLQSHLKMAQDIHAQTSQATSGAR
jgi:putative membrane protein